MDVSTITVSRAIQLSSAMIHYPLTPNFSVEGDTFFHSWEVVAEILNDPICKDMLIDVGMGVRHRVGNNITKAPVPADICARTCVTTVASCSHTRKSSSSDQK
jgi:hypothetical protein